MEALFRYLENLRNFLKIDSYDVFFRILAWLILGVPFIYVLSRWVRRITSKKLSPQQGLIASKLLLYSGLIFIVFSILMEMKFTLSHLLGAAGLIGIAIGFASQTSISNIISGLFLIGEKPFEVNDTITIGETTGVVMSIDMLSIKIRTYNNRYIRIPNENIIKSELTNITYFPIRRVDLPVSVAYKEDLSRVKRILLDIAKQNPFCLNEPEPQVFYEGFGSSSIDMLFVAWAQKSDWFKVKNQLFEGIKKRFDEELIEIPFPHISIYSGQATQPLPVEISTSKNSNLAEKEILA